MENPIILAALDAIFRLRPCKDYEVEVVSSPFPGVYLVRLGPLPEKYGIAVDKKAAIEYADTLISDQLENEPHLFDGEWLLRFAPGDYHENLANMPTERQKHAYIAEHGIDLERAIEDHRKGHANVNHWLESVFDAHSFSLRTENNVVFWRR